MERKDLENRPCGGIGVGAGGGRGQGREGGWAWGWGGGVGEDQPSPNGPQSTIIHVGQPERWPSTQLRNRALTETDALCNEEAWA